MCETPKRAVWSHVASSDTDGIQCLLGHRDDSGLDSTSRMLLCAAVSEASVCLEKGTEVLCCLQR